MGFRKQQNRSIRTESVIFETRCLFELESPHLASIVLPETRWTLPQIGEKEDFFPSVGPMFADSQ